jgi:hypothetical protein
MRSLCLSRSEEPPRDDSGRKRELSIILLIQGARLQKLEKFRELKVESWKFQYFFNFQSPFNLNDVNSSSPY